MATRARSARPLVVATSLLFDEMLSGAIAGQLRSRGHDVVAAVEDRSMIALSDEEMLAAAAKTDRALVTANIKDFVPLDQRYRAAGRSHAGLVFVSSKAFPQVRTFIGTVVVALDKLLKDQALRIDTVVFLQRPETRQSRRSSDRQHPGRQHRTPH